jgi:hypothetical protein
VVLLFLSLGALILWERPALTGTGSFQLKVEIRKAPPGTVVEAWAGLDGEPRVPKEKP